MLHIRLRCICSHLRRKDFVIPDIETSCFSCFFQPAGTATLLPIVSELEGKGVLSPERTQSTPMKRDLYLRPVLKYPFEEGAVL